MPYFFVPFMFLQEQKENEMFVKEDIVDLLATVMMIILLISGGGLLI